MDLFNAFAVDPTRLEKGVWHVFTAESDEIVEENEIGDRAAVLIASTDNPRYRQELQKKLRAMVSKRKLDAATDARETGALVADYIILDWRNWKIQGQDVPYSREQVIKIWTEQTWIRLKERLAALAQDHDAYKAIREEELIKN